MWNKHTPLKLSPQLYNPNELFGKKKRSPEF
jgi:hypothetical protein